MFFATSFRFSSYFFIIIIFRSIEMDDFQCMLRFFSFLFSYFSLLFRWEVIHLIDLYIWFIYWLENIFFSTRPFNRGRWIG